MGSLDRRPSAPLTRQQRFALLAGNALLKPFPNIVVPAAIAIVAMVVGVPLTIAVLVMIVAWVAFASVTFFDEGEADRLREDLKRKRQVGVPARPQLDLGALARPIADRLAEVQRQEKLIRQAIAGADLPFTEVDSEVDGFVRAAEFAATRAQLLSDFIADQGRNDASGRIAQLKSKATLTDLEQQLLDALAAQATAVTRAHVRLDEFNVQMERIAVEMANIRAQLLSVSATTQSAAQARMADDVRSLREQISAVATGMDEVLSSS